MLNAVLRAHLLESDGTEGNAATQNTAVVVLYQPCVTLVNDATLDDEG